MRRIQTIVMAQILLFLWTTNASEALARPMKAVACSFSSTSVVASPEGADINARDSMGDTMLIRTARNHDYYNDRDKRKCDNKYRAAIIRGLLARKDLEINAQKPGGVSALHEAVASHAPTLVAVLLSDKRLNPNLRDWQGFTPLLAALAYPGSHQADNDKVVALLLQDKRVDIAAATPNGMTALGLAYERFPFISSTLFDTLYRRMPPNLTDAQKEFLLLMRTPWHKPSTLERWLKQTPKANRLKYLLAHGCSPNIVFPGSQQRSPALQLYKYMRTFYNRKERVGKLHASASRQILLQKGSMGDRRSGQGTVSRQEDLSPTTVAAVCCIS